MKKPILYTAVCIAALSVGAALYLLRPQEEVVITEPVKAPVPAAPPEEPSPPKPEPKPAPQPIAKKQPVTPTAPPAPKAPPVPDRTAEQQERAARYYAHQQKRFNSLADRLDQETDPARRKNLIQNLSTFVRVDTLNTLEWAMTLEDATERQAALNAINKNALTGIGARIELDQTGLPKIRQTTLLGAAESSGMVEPGDYISGMVRADGSTVYFKGRSIQQIVQMLRGKPGSEIQLLVERLPTDGTTEPQSIDVPIQRSMIVVGPDY